MVVKLIMPKSHLLNHIHCNAKQIIIMKVIFGIITLLVGIALGIGSILYVFSESFLLGLLLLVIGIVLVITGFKVIQS